MIRGFAQKKHRRAQQDGDPDSSFLQRIRWQLAALMAGLLFTLLVVLGGTVYLTTQRLLRESLENTLVNHAERHPLFLEQWIATNRTVAPTVLLDRHRDQDPQGVFYTVLNSQLTVLGSTGPFSPQLVDTVQAQKALQTGRICCSLLTYQGQDYLVYSMPVLTIGGAGVIQASIAAGQYQSALESIRDVVIAVVAFGLAAATAITVVFVRRALQPIQQALRRQRDFVADAAHELRTPLAIIRTSAELGLAQETVEEQQRALEQTLEQNAHLTRLVDSLSLLARADSGAVTLEKQRVDLGLLAQGVVTDVEILAEERQVDVHVTAASPAFVIGDSGRLRQVLLILLDNALKVTPQGGSIYVGVERISGNVRLWVQDTGPGIAPEDLMHIFERFYRADRARTSEGTGLGLAIGRWIIEAHGGRITAGNVVGGGALFTAILPAAGQKVE